MEKKEEMSEAERVAIRLKKTYDTLMEYPKEYIANLLACKIVLEEKRNEV
jgi:hypothetical protein